jgi:hypothetical protein
MDLRVPSDAEPLSDSTLLKSRVGMVRSAKLPYGDITVHITSLVYRHFDSREQTKNPECCKKGGTCGKYIIFRCSPASEFVYSITRYTIPGGTVRALILFLEMVFCKIVASPPWPFSYAVHLSVCSWCTSTIQGGFECWTCTDMTGGVQSNVD